MALRDVRPLGATRSTRTRRAARSRAQIDRRTPRAERRAMTAVTGIKLYNAGSFFDPRRSPSPTTTPSPTALGGPRHASSSSRIRRWLARASTGCSVARAHAAGAAIAPMLEVAMGLETAHPEALDRLNKRMTLRRIRRRRRRPRAPRRGAARVPARLAAVRAASTNRTTGCADRSTPPSRAARRSSHSFRRDPATARMEALADRGAVRPPALEDSSEASRSRCATRGAAAASSSISGTSSGSPSCHALPGRAARSGFTP